MNIEASMMLYELYSYGTHEGLEKAWDTRGRGRHDRDDAPLPKAQPAPVRFTPLSPVITKTKEQKKSMPSKMYDKWLKKQEKGTKDLRQTLGQHPVRNVVNNINVGDKVTLVPGAKVMNPKTGEKYELKPGSKLKVLNILPTVGNADQMASVHSETKQNRSALEGVRENAYARIADLQLHTKVHEDAFEKMPVWTKSWSRNPQSPINKAQDIQPVPKSQVIMRTKTNDGADLTWVRPKEESEGDARALSSRPHGLRGRFSQTSAVPAGELDRPGYDRKTRIFDTTGMPTYLQTGSNSSVSVSTYRKGGAIRDIVIKEQNTTTYGHMTSAAKFSYTNAAAAVGMLKKRYGIKISLSRLQRG